MKKISFLIAFFLIFAFQLTAQTHRRGHGAADVQELGRSVFNALKENQFATLNNYLPDEVELRVLRRRSSPDMRAVLDQTSPESIQVNLQNSFNQIFTKTTANAFNWQNYQIAETNAQQLDKKNRLLYRVEVTLANMEGNEQQLVFEAIRVRNRYFLFKQMIFKGDTQPK